MFWMFPVTAIAYLDQGQLTPEARRALRDSWRTYMPYRGDTENHYLLYYTSLYLMSQMYPEDGPRTWYTGNSAAHNLEESRRWIEYWVHLTTTRGQGEYDSPHYISEYVIPMSYLAQWAKDPAMKKRAAMMLDYLIADYAAENLDGTWAGAHSRVYDRQLLEPSLNASNQFGWAWFGLGGRPETARPARGIPPLLPAGQPLRTAGDPAAKSPPTAPPPMSTTSASAPATAGVSTTSGTAPVYKTTYVLREYAVGSDQGGGAPAHPATLLGRDLGAAGPARKGRTRSSP